MAASYHEKTLVVYFHYAFGRQGKRVFQTPTFENEALTNACDRVRHVVYGSGWSRKRKVEPACLLDKYYAYASNRDHGAFASFYKPS